MPSRQLHLGSWQFAGSADLDANASALKRGMSEAAAAGVRLLITQECALTGYASVDRDSPADIDRRHLRMLTDEMAAAARKAGLWLALGTTVFHKGATYNSLRMISDQGRTARLYHKRILYGADAEHYAAGPTDQKDICVVDGVRVGLRICFEFRFPELFRELLRRRVDVAAVAFCMVGDPPAKRAVGRAHLQSRAAENALCIAAANNLAGGQNSPSCIVDADGHILVEAPTDREALITAAVAPRRLSDLAQGIRRIALGLQP